MPQLNPTPWLLAMLTIWLTLILLSLTKTLNSKYQNLPNSMKLDTKTTAPWFWPWP